MINGKCVMLDISLISKYTAIVGMVGTNRICLRLHKIRKNMQTVFSEPLGIGPYHHV